MCVVLVLLNTACAQKVRFNAATAIPTAEAVATITRDDNNNARITLEVEHLADPQRLDPPKEVYKVLDVLHSVLYRPARWARGR
jgi:hypothetical protein